MNLNKYKNPDYSEKVVNWIDKNLANYLKKNEENQSEIEHILDYLNSDKAPTRIKYMSYDEAKSGADKWMKTLIKKAANIVETEQDTEITFDFKNGMKLVKLVGKAAFAREGHLMSHCVSSYSNKTSSYIYSLRDKRNMPHCTIEVLKTGKEINQIKGKGNGSIHPKYAPYVIKSLEKIGKKLKGHDMTYLGYSELTDDNWKLLENNFDIKSIGKLTFDNKTFFYNNSNLKAK